jgi:biopolymer transport protein ExbB/TolQ
MAPAQTKGSPGRRFQGVLPALLLGLPLAAALLAALHLAPLPESITHYVRYPVENVEVVLFSCALGALGAKLWQHAGERAACRRDLVPAWDGDTVPVAEAPRLLAKLQRQPRSLRGTTLGKRLAAVLEFLTGRGSAADLDDQLRALADNDAVAQENSFALVRFITWAIPILGFLGTVLGITQAISGVTPEKLEHSLSTVTDGLAEAFDATALALGLTMVTMFLTFLVDRLEQGVLEGVDAVIDRQLAHRFERTSPAGGEAVVAVREHGQEVLRAAEVLVQRQAEVWARTLEEVDTRRLTADEQLQERFTAALETALRQALAAHAAEAATLHARTLEQQVATERLAEAVTRQAGELARLHAAEEQLAKVQESLARNLEVLAGAGSFEEAVHSLTAAVHLLTAKAQPRLRREGHPPGAAA